MILVYIILGVFFGLMGAVNESVVKTWKSGRLSYQGDKFLWNIPVFPIYAFGGLLMYSVMKALAGFGFLVSISIATLTVVFWEWLCGWFCKVFLHMRFWSYSKKALNLDGHICLESIVWWMILVSLFYFFAFQRLFIWEKQMESVIQVTNLMSGLVVLAMALFGVGVSWFRMRQIERSKK